MSADESSPAPKAYSSSGYAATLLADTSPATIATARQGNVSSVGTEHSDVVLPNVIPPRGTPLPPVGWQEGDPPWEPPRKVAKPVPETPPKTRLPEDYDASSGNTPPGWEGTWRQDNARLATARPDVPGHTHTPSKPPGPWNVDTPTHAGGDATHGGDGGDGK